MGMRFNLDATRDWADLVLKIMSTLAIAAGGVWAYFQWRVTDAAETGAQISTSAEVFPYRQGLCLVVIHAKPKNVGRVPISAGRNGLSVTLQELPPSLPPGAVNPNELKLRHAPVDVIAAWRTGGYLIEPGVEYDELQTEVAPVGSVLLARAELDVGDGTEVDQSTIVRADCTSAAPAPAASASPAPLSVAADRRPIEPVPVSIVSQPPIPEDERHAIEADRAQKAASDQALVRWTRILGVATLLLASGTVALWWATRRLVKGAEATAEKQLRSYVFVNVSIKQGVLWTASGNEQTSVSVRFANHGSTPAQLMRIRAVALALTSAPTRLPDTMDDDVASGIGLGPQSSDSIPVRLTVSPDELKAIERREKTIYCFGCIEYEDVLGTRRETGFCWSLQLRGEDQVFTITPGTPLNYRT